MLRAEEDRKGVVGFPSASSWLRCARVMVRRSLVGGVGLRARGIGQEAVRDTPKIVCAKP